MIVRLRGKLIEKQAPMLVLEVNNIGYEIYMPLNSFYQLPPIGEEICLFTHFVIREDAQILYGFLEKAQRDLFRILIKVNGIGPKSALTILSGIEPDVLARCILSGDDTCLLRIPGIGKKTAQRLLIEAKDSIEAMKEYPASQNSMISDATRDAVSALIALGYKPQQATKAIDKHKDKKLSSEELIKLALKDVSGV